MKALVICKFQPRYFVVAMMLFFVEVVIGFYVHDTIVRPYIGDVLVVILLYSFLHSFVQMPIMLLALMVLMIAFLIEGLQYFHFLKMIGLQQSAVARVVFGTSFAWMDLLAYTVGIAIVLILEKMLDFKR